MKCECGEKLPKRKNCGPNWGDWTCKECGHAYCQDCKSPIHMGTMQCIAYQENKEDDKQ